MAYCEVVDLLIGDIPTGGALDPQKYVNDAADEIDSKIGFRYATPVDTDAAPRPVTLLLKRINAHLASGRLILAATITVEDKQLNAYGQSLVDGAQFAIEQIATGVSLLPDVPASPTAGDIGNRQKIVSANVDPESNVEAFYDRIARPGVTLVSPYPSYWPGGGG